MKKKVLILGYGISGKAAEKFLEKQQKSCLVYDDKIAKLQVLPWEEIETLVVSPQISISHPIYQKAIEKGVKITSEIQLGLEDKNNPLIGVTGTNGKTTTVLLLEHLCKTASIPAKALGNIGEPLSLYSAKEGELLIVELSSFQLEKLQGNFFDYAFFLNLYPHHLDVHESFAAYQKAKVNLQNCIKKEGKLWAPSNYSALFRKAEGLQKLPFSIAREDLSATTLEAAWTFALEKKISSSVFLQAVQSFQKPSHRFEKVAQHQGITYINDSKATNTQAVLYALSKLFSPIRLIVGGEDQNADFRLWQNEFSSKVKKVYAYGFAAEKIRFTLESSLRVECFPLFGQAVKKACVEAQKEEVVLLSPGCASHDQFANFEERGNKFKELVQMWMQKGS